MRLSDVNACEHGFLWVYQPGSRVWAPQPYQTGSCPCLGSCERHQKPARYGDHPPNTCPVCHEPDASRHL